MEETRYAPPKALVADGIDLQRRDARPAPPLWNPNAAASWCLLFSPVFGAWLHLRNWEALGEPVRAAAARRWLVAAIAVLAVSMLLSATVRSASRLSQLADLVFLITWYYASAKPQARFVLGRYGTTYPRRGWLKPILVAIGLLLGVMFALGTLMMLVGA